MVGARRAPRDLGRRAWQLLSATQVGAASNNDESLHERIRKAMAVWARKINSKVRNDVNFGQAILDPEHLRVRAKARTPP